MPDFPPVDVHERDTILRHQAVNLPKARDLDVQFLRSATDTRYRPLQDLKSSDPSTVKTAMVEAQLLSSDCGQQFVVVTADQQIYKVILDNTRASQEMFRNIYPQFGGLHTIMSFSGSVISSWWTVI